MPIPISNPLLQTGIFSLVLLITLLVSIRKNTSTDFFPISLTQELKGFAILLVLFAHIGYELFQGSDFLFPLSTLGGVGVNLFLLLSGYGLTVSATKKNISIKSFYQNRFPKLYLPLWLSLILILSLDFLILQKFYPITEVINAFLGFFPKANGFVNINAPLWYFTAIIFYYLLFPLVFFKKVPVLSAITIYLISILVLKLNLPIDHDVLSLYKTHNTAFPIGMLFAILVTHKNTFFIDFLKKLKNNLVINIILLISLAYGIWYTAIYSGVGINLYQEQLIAMITTFMIIFFFYFKKFRIKSLYILGIFSYEIYLLHWPIIYHFDFLYRQFPASLATIIYISIFLGLGYILQKITNQILKKLTTRS